MDLQLKNKLAFISGSTQGIGKAIAEVLLKEGATVIVNGRTDVEDRISDLRDLGDIYAITEDLSDEKGVNGAIRKIDDIGELDILVNNLGIFSPTDFTEITDEDWFRYFETNVMSTVRMSRHYLPKMMKSDFGRIINIASDVAFRGIERMLHYSMSKGAQVVIGRGLANLTQGCGGNLTVNSVLPGPTMTEGVSRMLEKSASKEGIEKEEAAIKYFKEVETESLLQRFIDPIEIAYVVAFLCSPLSIPVNGASVRVEGGIIRSI